MLTVFGTGFGAIEPDSDGEFSAPVGVTIGGEPAQLLSASRVKDTPGVVQLRVRIPEWSGTGTVPFEIHSGVESGHILRTVEIK